MEAVAHASLASAVPGNEVVGDVLLVESEIKLTRAGDPYWKAKLMDREGATLGANRFDFDPDELPAVGSVLRIEGVVEKLGSGRILRIRGHDCLTGEEADAWLPRARVEEAILAMRLEEAIERIGDDALRALVFETLRDPDVRKRFMRTPAATRNHSPRVGGLLLHSLAVARIALELVEALDGFACDRDMVSTAALLHDVGKIDEIELSLATGGSPEYTVGQLQGHIIHGVRRVERAARAAGLDPGRLEHIIHLIASHHGTHQWGSPVVPMTPEAVVLHAADYAASRLEAVLDASDACEAASEWTGYSHCLGAKVFLGFSSPR